MTSTTGPFTALIFPYGEDPDFTSLQFRVAFKATPSLDAINGWNRDKRYGKAFLDEDGDAAIDYDLDLEGGATERTVLESVRTFRALVNDFSSVAFGD